MPRVAKGSASGPREVRGRVLRPGADSAVAYAGVRVTLHRVGPDRAAPMDSTLTDAAGRYAFTYRPSGDTTALYFVSASRSGIAYFTPPLREARVEGEAAEIVLFDTTSAAVPIHVRGRHFVVAAPDTDGTRLVVEVFEVSNDSSVTRIAAPAGATFETPVPAGITDFTAGDGEVTASAMSLVRDRVRVIAPMMPGVKQFSFNYRLPATTGDFSVPVPVPTSVLEVLLEEPAATASGAGLKAVATATSSGRTFRRYLAQDVAAGKQVAITLPSRVSSGRRLRLALAVTAVGAVMLIGFARAFRRRGEGAAPAAGTGVDAEAAIAALERELVELDDTFARKARPTVEERGEHVAARARVKARLADAIAARDGIA
ncbi:MAG: hypothetical protein HY084_09295 [Gemmatimonadetes bacterium]|nr:hypothetical protein [Gemmatimonadota bacterium]